MRKKISVIGAGNVGATCVQRIAEKGYAPSEIITSPTFFDGLDNKRESKRGESSLT